MVLFQLLGGRLPYEESSWLNSRDLNKYRSINDEIEKQIFSNDCIKKKIEKGKIVVLSTLPPWVCTPLRRTISKACNVDPTKRYQSCSEFLAKLNSISKEVHDWVIDDGIPTRICLNCKYRIMNNKKNNYFVEKEKNSGWRKDNSFSGESLRDLVKEIEKKR
jgi:serine/threonine protein kinase